MVSLEHSLWPNKITQYITEIGGYCNGSKMDINVTFLINFFLVCIVFEQQSLDIDNQVHKEQRVVWEVMLKNTKREQQQSMIKTKIKTETNSNIIYLLSFAYIDIVDIVMMNDWFIIR